MRLHDLEFGGRQGAPLQEDAVGNPDLAHVVQKGTGNQVRDIFRRDPSASAKPIA
jgi:hypothetical protein